MSIKNKLFSSSVLVADFVGCLVPLSVNTCDSTNVQVLEFSFVPYEESQTHLRSRLSAALTRACIQLLHLFHTLYSATEQPLCLVNNGTRPQHRLYSVKTFIYLQWKLFSCWSSVWICRQPAYWGDNGSISVPPERHSERQSPSTLVTRNESASRQRMRHPGCVCPH